MKTNLYLIGFMGVGKSAVSRYLDTQGHMHRVEMDQEIEKREKMTIPEIFAREGEEYFRDRETELLRELSDRQGIVVSCGGGVPKREENIRLMKESGTVVWLEAEPETILERVSRNNNRPLLEGKKNIEAIRDMMQERRPLYERAADIRVRADGRPVCSIAKEILKRKKWTG